MQRTSTTGWIVAVVSIAALVILFVVLADSWWEVITELPSVFIGMVVGSYLMLGVYRLLGWGESAAGSVVIWSFVGGGALLFLLAFLVGDVPDEPEPNLETIVFYTGLGIVFGIWWRVQAIRNRLRRTETTETEPRP